MKFQEWLDWLGEHREIGFDLMRIYLGIGLFIKGLFFIGDTQFLSNLLLQSGRLQAASTAIAHYIPIAHLGGGALIAMGFLTRTAVLFQLPILVGAVFLVHLEEGLFTKGQNLEFTLLVLFLLLLLLVHGAGPLSVDAYLRKDAEEGEVESAVTDDGSRHAVR